MVRQLDIVVLRAPQPPLCKADLRRHIVHTSSKANAVRAAAEKLPAGESVCVRTGVSLARRMPNMPSQERLVANADRRAEHHNIKLTDH